MLRKVEFYNGQHCNMDQPTHGKCIQDAFSYYAILVLPLCNKNYECRLSLYVITQNQDSKNNQ